MFKSCVLFKLRREVVGQTYLSSRPGEQPAEGVEDRGDAPRRLEHRRENKLL